MRPRTAFLLFCSVLFFISLFSPCSARKRRSSRNRRRGRKLSCLKLGDALEKAYYAQVDLIRRGLPRRVVQSEFTWAINYFISIYSGYKSIDVKGSCVKKEIWKRVFDASFRSTFAMKYLHDIRLVFPSITFLGFEEYPTLSTMSNKQQALVHTMWETTLVRLLKSSRSKYKVSDFPFPHNVDVLHDPRRKQACGQYHKFRTGFKYKSKDEDADGESVLVALTTISIELYRRGANKNSITQMLKHFVGYVFTGIRCLRVEGADLKIPRKLVEAYSRNIGMIRGTVTRDQQEGRIKPAAVKRVFKEEIGSLLSYNSWGHLQYAILSPQSSIPVKIDVIPKLLGRTQYGLLLHYSKSPELLSSQRYISDDNAPQKNEKLHIVERKKKYITCDDGYMLMPREGEVTDPLEQCCNEICHQWSELLQRLATYSAEDCCSRCNQVNYCDSGITSEDLRDNNNYSFYIPEYGEQDQIDMFLVAL